MDVEELSKYSNGLRSQSSITMGEQEQLLNLKEDIIEGGIIEEAIEEEEEVTEVEKYQ